MGCFLLLVLPVNAESFISKAQAVKPEYREVLHDSEIYALIGGNMVLVGQMKEGLHFQINPTAAEYYEFNFGHGTGFIENSDVAPSSKKHINHDELGELSKPSSGQNLLTQQAVTIYSKMDRNSREIAALEANLRYPIVSKLSQANQVWYEVNIGGHLGYINAEDCQLDNGIPVLTFHHILKDEENKYFLHTSTTTSESAFSEQMAYLKQQGYQTITLVQLESYLKNQINLPAKVVVLTFDDGLKSVNRYAYPILKREGFHAAAFIISSRIKHHPQKWNADSLQFMSISELEDIQDVFEIQSHTHFLHRLDNRRKPILLRRDFHNIEFDFARSRRALEQFNPDVAYLAYPFGGYNQVAIAAAKSAGFRMAFITLPGKVKPGDGLYTLKRLYVLRTDSIESMANRIANEPASEVNQTGRMIED